MLFYYFYKRKFVTIDKKMNIEKSKNLYLNQILLYGFVVLLVLLMNTY